MRFGRCVPPWQLVCALLLGAALQLGCGAPGGGDALGGGVRDQEAATSTAAAVRSGAAIASSERQGVLGPFLARHWALPLAAQGPGPEGWSDAERSLDPGVCGSCHPAQFAQWKRSFHAGAFSPGFSGQLIEGELAAGEDVRACQACHAPLAEQMPAHASADAAARFDPALRAQGLVCAACHVRLHRVFGPPRREGASVPPEPRPHGGFEPRQEYLESRFCAACHQFFDDEGINGKPIENTFVEWQASPQAAAGRSCQSCHMPDRAHLWRGIHDREMVRSGVDVALLDIAGEGAAARDRGAAGGGSRDEIALALVLVNRDVGHAFPTYVTPRVFLALWQENAAGAEIEGSRVQAVIGREIDFSGPAWSEVFDTRVAPGQSVRLDYVRARREGAVTLVARVSVDPDFHYRGVYAAILPGLRSAEARARIERARQRARESIYVLWQQRRTLAPPGS